MGKFELLRANKGHGTRRRELIGLIAAILAAAALPSAAEPPMVRVAILREAPLTDPAVAHGWRIFVEELEKNGWREGRNIVFDQRDAAGNGELYAKFASELVALEPSVIVTIGSATTAAVRQQTKTISIVMIGPGDPVGSGFVASLAHPGGNITGVSSQLAELSGKALQFIKELRPSASRVVFFWRPDNPAEVLSKRNYEAVAPSVGLTVEGMPVTTDRELDAALSVMAAAPPDALMITTIPPARLRTREIAAFAIEHRMLTLAPHPAMVHDGLLLSIGPRGDELSRRAAAIVAKILNGAKPPEIPVEQPTAIGIAVNLKTAKAIGLVLPPTLLVRADEVIE